ncbi:MAG: flagellar export chaperone FlgN [Planctomycetota bacterium]
MKSQQTEHAWQSDLAELLEDLIQVQDELLDVLCRKRECMAAGDQKRMAELQPVEEQLCRRLRSCHDRRSMLLQEVRNQGLPWESLGGLASLLGPGRKEELRKKASDASARMGLLQHNCLANWVLAQKALLHVSQMLEIIASGGRLEPTYGHRAGPAAGGTLVDQQA